MRYWDASGIVPSVLIEATTPSVVRLLGSDRHVITWWATPIEVLSAVARLAREGMLSREAESDARSRLEQLRAAWVEIDPSETVRRDAMRLLRVHPLRAADALQLAAALTAAQDQADAVEFVTRDRRLADAADREGFRVIVPSEAGGR